MREDAMMLSRHRTIHGRNRLTGCQCCTEPSRREFVASVASRRQFVAGLAGLGAATLGGGLTLPNLASAQHKASLIDTHHHFYPPEYQKAWLGWEESRKL